MGSMELSLADDNVADVVLELVTAVLLKGLPRRILGGPPPLKGWNILRMFLLNGSSWNEDKYEYQFNIKMGEYSLR